MGNTILLCINSVQLRAMRFILGTGRHTPNNAIYGEIAWHPPHVKQWKSVAQHWHRIKVMDKSRVNHRIFMYCHSKSNNVCKNWQFRFIKYMNDIRLSDTLFTCNVLTSKIFCEKVLRFLLQQFVSKWRNDVNSDVGPSGRGRNKLRTYKTFKHDFILEKYVSSHIPVKHRAAYAKFRFGVAPLKLETGRFENLAENHRLCPICRNNVENEIHVLFHCSAYHCLRNELTERACELNSNINNLCDEDKLIFVLSNENMIKISAKTCFMILKSRSNILYS